MGRLAIIGFAAAGLAFAASAEAKDCRADEVPASVRLPTPCKDEAGKDRRLPQKPVRDRGFIDLGNGTEIRIGGRAGVESEFRR